ncbi:MAG: hypothetical protein KAT65_27695, partial [Methanophagales archaeon]|nr:hypothetical protein [Methanophagales archaeon]
KSIFDPKELNEIISMIRKSKVCRVTGPHIQNGNKVNGNENIVDFNVHSNTKFLVVSDLGGLRESNPADFNSIKNQHKNYDNLFSICDIKEDVDTFCSLDAFLNENKNKSVIISSNSQKKSEQVFKDGDDERATKFAEELKNRVNKRKWNYLLEPIVYGAKQEYSRILRLFTYFEILWLICLGLEISLLAARDVITGKESIGFMIFVWFFLMGIICGSVYLIQFLWVKKVRKKQQIERQKIIGDYRGDKKMDACCAVCGKKSRIRYKLNKQYVCKECLKKGQEEYLRAIIEKWQECPICGSKEGFEIEVGLVSKLACKSCLAEWTLSRTMIGGEIKGIRLSKADSENRAVRYLLKKHPLEWWAEKKWTEERTGKEEAENKVTETKEEPVEKMEIGKYERLGKYLNGLKEKEVTLTFEQIEYILGFQLPSSARQYPAWWANDKTHSHAVKGWLNCGWQSRNLNFSEEIVQFFQVNKKAELKPEIPITIERYLDYHLKKTNEDVKKVFLALRNKILRLGDVEERIKKSEVSYNIKYRIIFADFFGFHQDHIWMYLKLNKEVEDPKGLTEYDETGFDIGFKRKLKLTKDTDIDYTLGLVKNAIKATTSRDIVKIGAEGEHEVEMPIVKKEHLIIERAIYDPCKRDFIERALPRMKDWIERHDPGAYWFAISIQNNSDKTIDEWGVGLETSSALKVKEARVEGMEYKIELHESYPELFKSKYIIGVPKEYGLVIPKGGAQRVYFKLRAEKPKTTYEIGGVFKSEISGDVPIRAKEFKYLCDTGVSPEAVKAELKKTFSGKDAARLANTFRISQEIRSSYCNTDTTAKEINKEFDLLKIYLTEKEFLDEIESIQRRTNAELREDERLDEKHVEEVKGFCEKFTEMWIARFLR